MKPRHFGLLVVCAGLTVGVVLVRLSHEGSKNATGGHVSQRASKTGRTPDGKSADTPPDKDSKSEKVGGGATEVKDGKGIDKSEEVARILRAHAEVSGRRPLSFYAVDTVPREIKATKRALISSGHVIIGGRLLVPPYDVRLGNRAVTINGMCLEPRYAYRGFTALMQMQITPGMEKRGQVAQLIADKKESLCKELGDYLLVIPKLAAYARGLDLVDRVDVEGVVVRVVFAPEEEGAEPQEVGYVCRRRRRPRRGSEWDPLLGLYQDVCEALRKGKCALSMPTGAIRFLEDGGVVERTDKLVGSCRCDLGSTLEDCAAILDAICECFGKRISMEEAAAILVNWGAR